MRLTLIKDLTRRLPPLYLKQPTTHDVLHAMKTNSESFLNSVTAGCVLGVLLLLSAGRVRGDSEETIDKATSASVAAATRKNNITGTWSLSIHYTGGGDRSADTPNRVSGPVKGNDVSNSAPATKNVDKWTTARFVSFRVTDPPPENLKFTLKQEGEKLAGTYYAPRGRQKVSGARKGKDVSFSVAVTNSNGERITGRFKGEVLSSGKMEGTVTYDLKSFFDVTETRLGPATFKGELAK